MPHNNAIPQDAPIPTSDTLHDDVWRGIFAHLTPSDVQALKGVCNAFTTVLARVLF
jgi:hypothetical protein